MSFDDSAGIITNIDFADVVLHLCLIYHCHGMWGFAVFFLYCANCNSLNSFVGAPVFYYVIVTAVTARRPSIRNFFLFTSSKTPGGPHNRVTDNVGEFPGSVVTRTCG